MKTRVKKLVAIVVVASFAEFIKAPSSPEDAPLMSTVGGKFGNYLGDILIATVLVLVCCWLGEGVIRMVKRDNK